MSWMSSNASLAWGHQLQLCQEVEKLVLVRLYVERDQTQIERSLDGHWQLSSWHTHSLVPHNRWSLQFKIILARMSDNSFMNNPMLVEGGLILI